MVKATGDISLAVGHGDHEFNLQTHLHDGRQEFPMRMVYHVNKVFYICVLLVYYAHYTPSMCKYV